MTTSFLRFSPPRRSTAQSSRVWIGTPLARTWIVLLLETVAASFTGASKRVAGNRSNNDDRLAHLSAQNPAIDWRRLRRPLSPEEFARLLESVEKGPSRQSLTGPDRVIVHILACYTGLRRNKIGSGKAHSFNFDSDPPTLTVDAGYSKHRRTDVMPIRVDLAKRIQDWIASKKKLDPTKPLVNVALKRTAEMLKKDLAAARAAWITESPDAEEHKRREKPSFLK